MVDEILIEIIQLLIERQQILTRLVIHWGCRDDLYDDFVAKRFEELEDSGLKSQSFNLIKADSFKEDV